MKVDDRMHGHPGALLAGVAAMGLWVLAGSWCAAHLTDGWIPAHIAAHIDPEYKQHAAALVRGGLWVPARQDGQRGWQFVDWLVDNPSREQTLAKRAADAARQQRARDRAAATRHGVTHADVTASITVPPTRPDPTQPPPPSPPGFTAEWEQRVVDQLTALRPDWLEEDIRRALAHRKVRQRPPEVVALAAVLLAKDPTTQRVSRLAANHQYWSAARSPAVMTSARKSGAIPPHRPADDGLGGCTACPLPARHMIHQPTD